MFPCLIGCERLYVDLKAQIDTTVNDIDAIIYYTRFRLWAYTTSYNNVYKHHACCTRRRTLKFSSVTSSSCTSAHALQSLELKIEIDHEVVSRVTIKV